MCMWDLYISSVKGVDNIACIESLSSISIAGTTYFCNNLIDVTRLLRQLGGT
jgi:hypothetical protein